MAQWSKFDFDHLLKNGILQSPSTIYNGTIEGNPNFPVHTAESHTHATSPPGARTHSNRIRISATCFLFSKGAEEEELITPTEAFPQSPPNQIDTKTIHLHERFNFSAALLRLSLLVKFWPLPSVIPNESSPFSDRPQYAE